MEYQWINRLEQFGSVDITLLIHDPEGIFPDGRIDKSYNLPPEQVDEAFLSEQAVIEGLNYVTRLAEAGGE